LFFEFTTRNPADETLSAELTKLLADQTVLGLKARVGVPETPEHPGLACRVVFQGTAEKPSAIVSVSMTDASGKAWTTTGKFTLPLTDKAGARLKTEALARAIAEGVLGRIVRVQLSKGPKAKGKETYLIRIDNASPLVLDGLALTGTSADAKQIPSALSGLGLPPRRRVTLPATAGAVERLGLKTGVRASAADLSGL